VAAAVGWIPLNGSHQGVLAVGGLTAFLAVVWVVRQYSVVERGRIAWTRGRVALVAGGVVALVAISLSYGVLHPLTAGNSGSAGPNKTGVWLHNEGRLPVRVLAISAPGPRVVRARLEAGGATIARGDSRLAYVARPCGSFDRLIILVRVAGRDVEQTVHVAQPSEFSC
jgi:hypothetical protein